MAMTGVARAYIDEDRRRGQVRKLDDLLERIDSAACSVL